MKVRRSEVTAASVRLFQGREPCPPSWWRQSCRAIGATPRLAAIALGNQPARDAQRALQAPDAKQSQEHGMAKGVGLAPARGDPVVINKPDNQISLGFRRRPGVGVAASRTAGFHARET